MCWWASFFFSVVDSPAAACSVACSWPVSDPWGGLAEASVEAASGGEGGEAGFLLKGQKDQPGPSVAGPSVGSVSEGTWQEEGRVVLWLCVCMSWNSRYARLKMYRAVHEENQHVYNITARSKQSAERIIGAATRHG